MRVINKKQYKSDLNIAIKVFGGIIATPFILIGILNISISIQNALDTTPTVEHIQQDN